jgi:hypothetical protein
MRCGIVGFSMWRRIKFIAKGKVSRRFVEMSGRLRKLKWKSFRNRIKLE